MAKLAILPFFLAATNSLIIRDNYDVVTKYNCWNKGEIFLDRGLVFRLEEDFLNSWPGNVAFDCQMPVTNRYKSPGIISTIQYLKFRQTGDNCIDHIKFSNDDKRRCGEMIMGQTFLNNGTIWDPPKFISEFAGPFLVGKGSTSNHLVSFGASVNPSSAVSVYIHVDGRSLQPGERLAFSVSFTGFVAICRVLNESSRNFLKGKKISDRKCHPRAQTLTPPALTTFKERYWRSRKFRKEGRTTRSLLLLLRTFIRSVRRRE